MDAVPAVESEEKLEHALRSRGDRSFLDQFLASEHAIATWVCRTLKSRLARVRDVLMGVMRGAPSVLSDAVLLWCM